MRALERHDVAHATSCIACALEMRSSNGRERLQTRSDPIKGKDTPPLSALLASCAMAESQNNGRITWKSWRNSGFFFRQTNGIIYVENTVKMKLILTL